MYWYMLLIKAAETQCSDPLRLLRLVGVFQKTPFIDDCLTVKALLCSLLYDSFQSSRNATMHNQSSEHRKSQKSNDS